jgi:hypothetical protein
LRMIEGFGFGGKFWEFSVIKIGSFESTTSWNV